jgi:TPR repeat protein
MLSVILTFSCLQSYGSRFQGRILESLEEYESEEDDDSETSTEGYEEGDDGGDDEEPLTEEEAAAMNRSRSVLVKVVSLSWPSEGVLGLKFSEQNSTKNFSWSKAEAKAMAMLVAIDAELRDAPSEEILLALAYRHFYGIGTPKDCAESLSAYKAVAESVSRYMEENDVRESRLDPGLMRISLSEVDGVLGEEEEDENEALEWDILNANGGDLWSQKEVGWRALVGRGLDENHAEALQHLRRAAAANDPDAQHNLGYMYMNGLGVPRNYTEARKHFEAAATYNITAAYNALGYMHYKGTGVPRNLTLGEHYLRLAADLDDADAAFNLAALYEEQDGNLTRALPYMQQVLFAVASLALNCRL